MPIYDFVCTNPECKHEFEEFLTSNDFLDSVHTCPKCGKPAKKVISTPARMKHNWSKWNATGN